MPGVALVDWASAGTMDSAYGMEQRIWNDTRGPCWGVCGVCRQPANIIDWGFESWVCSKTCHTKSWDQYERCVTEDEAYDEHERRGYGAWGGGSYDTVDFI